MAGFFSTLLAPSTGWASLTGKDPIQIAKKASAEQGGSKTPIGDSYAQMTRDQWATYVNTFVPLENKLIQYATNPQVVNDAMLKANTDVDSAYAAQEGSTQRRLAGMGVSLSPDEQAAQTKAYGLSKSLAEVGAQNNARDLTMARQQSILGNPAPAMATGKGG